MNLFKMKLTFKLLLLMTMAAVGLLTIWKTKLLNTGSIEGLLNPGRLALKHAKYESDCANCHRPFNKKAQKGLCLDCHKEISEDLKNRRGVHGGVASSLDTDCKFCHTEHKGREFDIRHLDEKTFDHKLTGFALAGAHANLNNNCNACHLQDKAYREVSADCFSCHAKNDTHKGQQGKDCASCHIENSWREVKNFDHDLTAFPLIGLHAVATCQECHLSSAFKDAKQDCFSCHLKDDYHKGILGKDCAKCHNPNGWKLWEFDHNTQASYKLEGAHESLECQACHKKPVGKDSRLSGKCITCHEKDDRHDGRFGELCEQCHTVESFKKISFFN